MSSHSLEVEVYYYQILPLGLVLPPPSINLSQSNLDHESLLRSPRSH